MTIKVVAYASDGGDGGGSIFVYNTLDELREAHFKPDEQNSKADCEKRFQSALNGYNPFDDGEIINTCIEIESNADGSMRLAKPLFLPYGQ